METQSKRRSKLKRDVQKKTFTAWANSILKERNRSSFEIDDLFKSFRNGQMLGKLIENLSDEKVRRLSPGKSRQQSVDNVEICLDFLEKKRVSTRGIDSEDIVDGCPDTTLELMWAIITELYINKKELLKKGEKKTMEDALLLWAQDKTKGYRDVRVKDFTSSSWKDGLAFLALINAHRPNLYPFKHFRSDERRHNLKTAFDAAEDELGIPSLLDVEDMMKSQVDEMSVATYVACFYKRFEVTDTRRRRSRSESRSDDSDSSSRSKASHSGGDRTERKRRSRSSSKTRRSSRNKHKQRESSNSRSSSSSSNSSDECKGRRGLTNKSERGHSSCSTASSSSGRSTTRRGSKNRSGRVRSRSSVISGSTPETRKERKGFRNISEKGTKKSNSPEQYRNDGKRRKRRDMQRSTDRSLSRTSNRRDRRSHSRERKHSSDRSLSRTRRIRRYSNSPDRRGIITFWNRGCYKRSPGSSRNKDSYKENFHVPERRNSSSSSIEQDDEYLRTCGSKFYTLSRKQREKYLNYHPPTQLGSYSQIRKEIPNPERHPNFSRNGHSQGEEMDSVFDKLRLLGQRFGPQTIPLKVPSNLSAVRFEWQFLDDNGAWITYGKSNSAGNGSNATTTTSDDIENHFVANPNSLPVLVQTQHNHYILDFQSKTQTNMNTNVQSQIRRIPKQSANITPVNVYTFPHAVPMNPAPVSFEWQFEDEHGSWISYGKPNSAGNVSHITTTCSDDIEKHYVSNPANLTPLTINSMNNAQYVLDFKNMTQTNQQTSVQRKIRRVPKVSPSNTATPKGSTFVWSFKDEHGNWIKYGETSSSNDATSATTTTSDDIETKYARNPTASLEIASGHHKYIIDFNAMTQTNINTKVVRAIRRQLVTPSDLPSNWTPMKASDKGLLVVALKATDTEYINQVAFVKKTLPSSRTINKVFRIQNKHLWRDFVSRKRRLKRRNPQIKYKEVYLFHVTDPKHVQSICADNLDFRLNGTHGTMYGQGTYFATSAADSANSAGSSYSGKTSKYSTNLAASGYSANSAASPYSDKTSKYSTNLAASGYSANSAASPYSNKTSKYSTNLAASGYSANSAASPYSDKTSKYSTNLAASGYSANSAASPYSADNADSKYKGKSVASKCSTNYVASGYSANSAASVRSGATKLMFIVKVLIGHYTVGSTSLRTPPKDASGVFYDATVDNQANPTIYVKYDNTEYYPEYYIEFT